MSASASASVSVSVSASASVSVSVSASASASVSVSVSVTVSERASASASARLGDCSRVPARPTQPYRIPRTTIAPVSDPVSVFMPGTPKCAAHEACNKDKPCLHHAVRPNTW